ncbi:MAG: hypothetical protein J0I23_30625 [Rhizobiales bacterium]|nr:hypothetical protein [Hyphomicrobiales bacterium]
MSANANLISELVRAANEVEKLGDFEVRRLLERAVVTIREMRSQAGIRPSRTNSDAVIDFQTVSGLVNIGRRSNDDVKAALLKSATMIRALKIMLDAKDETSKGE